jgi:hypothetical protein
MPSVIEISADDPDALRVLPEPLAAVASYTTRLLIGRASPASSTGPETAQYLISDIAPSDDGLWTDLRPHVLRSSRIG